jgi:autotransporter-associated beta strand protein
MKPQFCTDSSGSLLAKQTARLLCWWASLALCLPLASAADGTWTGANGATWNTTATNWTGVTGAPWDSGNGTSNTANFTATSGNATVSGTVFVNGISYTAASGSFAIESGTISVGGTTPSISVNTSRTLTINSMLAGSTAWSKAGAGTLVLGGANTYDGSTTINAGTLTISNNTALGSIVGGTTIALGASLNLQGNITVGAEALTHNGGTFGYLRNVSGNNAWNGDITVGSANSRIRSEAGLLTIGGNITMNAVTIFEGASNTTVTGVVSGASALNLGGNMGDNAVVTLSGNNSYTGATSVNRGSVTANTLKDFGVDSSLGRGTGGTAIQLGAASTNGTLNYTGGATSSNRTFRLGSNTAGETGGSVIKNNGSGALTFSATGFNLQSSSANSARILTLGGSNTDANTISGAIIDNNASAAVGLTKADAGTWVLSGSNTYSGATSINAGILVFRNTSARSANTAVTVGAAGIVGLGVGAGSGDYSDANVAALFNSSLAGFTLNATSGVALDTTAGNFTQSTSLTASRGLTKLGNNTLTLTGSNTYSGDTMISAGTLALGGSGSLGGGAYSGNIANSGTFTLNTTATQTLSGIISGNGSLTKNNTGTLTLSGNNTYSGSTTVSAGVINIQHANGLGTTASGTTVSSGAALQLQGGITVGAEALSLTGNGVSTDGALRNISGSNTYGGAITLAGATRINSDADLLTLSGGISGTQNLTIGGAGNTTVSNAIATTTGTLTKDGAGTLVLSGANSYTGTTTISAGNLTISSGSAISDSGVVTLGNATGAILHVAGSEIIGTLSGGGSNGGDISIAASQALTVNQTATGTFAGIISGGGSLTKNGSSTLTLTGSNTYDGATTINAGVLNIRHNNALGTAVGGTTVASGAALQLQGNITITGETLSLTGGGFNNDGALRNISGNNTWTGDITTQANNTRIQADAESLLTISGNISTAGYSTLLQGNGTTNITGVISGASGAVTLSAAGSGKPIVTLSGNNTYTGATTINAGALQIGAGGTSGSLSSSTSITNNANLVFNRSDSLNVSNAISGIGNLTQAGAGTLVLTGNNGYNGTTVVNAGTLQIGAGGSSGNLSTNSTITNNGTLVFNRSGTITQGTNFANSISGTGNLTQAGSGTLFLGGTNSYTGLTTISAGNLSINATTAIGSTSGINLANASALIYTGGPASLGASITVTGGTGTIRNSGTGLLTLSGALSKNGTTLTLASGSNGITVSGVISGSNANSDLVIDGGTTTLANANNDYNGPTFIINSGTLNANTAGALPTSTLSAVTINGSSTLALGASQSISSLSGTSGSSVNLNANTLTINGSATTTYSGGISGTGNLVKNGSGTQTLAGATTFNGTTTVNSGTLQAATANALANTSQVVLNNGGSFLVTAENAVNDNAAINLNGGRMAMSGNFNETVGALTLSANSTIDFSGFVGTLRFSGVGSWAAGANLAIWNWSGQTQHGTNYGTYPNNSNLVFTNNSTLSSNLANISFYSDSGTTSIGSGFERGFTGGGTEIIAVPETETYFYAVALLAGVVIQYLRRRAKRKPLEGHRPA